MHRPSIKLTAFVAFIIAATPVMQSARTRATERYFAGELPEDVYYLPPPPWLRVLDLGYHEASSDLLWSVALVYAGDGLRNRMGAKYVVAYARAMTTLDPTWTRPFRWAPIAAAYQAAAPPVEQLEDAGRFVASGVERFPENGEVAWAAGSFFAYELAPRYPPRSRERIEARRTGLTYMISAARRGAGPAWLALANASSMSQMGHLELAIAHLREMAELTTDPELRAEIARRLAVFGAAMDSAAARQVEELERSRIEHFPYLSEGLYELVGAPIVEEDP